MLKLSTFAARNELGPTAIPLFGKADAEFEKTASPYLLPPVLQYIQDLRPRQDAQYVLVNALGASEYFGSNVNGDAFPEAALIHAPPGATGNPLVDRAIAKQAAYGYLTFYNAHPFAHHRNKDPSRAYGEVELAVWNDVMKRVELVVRVDYDKCQKFGGTAVWDKLKTGQFPDVSMGCFKKGALVTMSDGSRKPIEEVQPGDYVLTHRGRSRRVRAAQVRPYKGYIYEIKAEAHEPIYCTDEHPFFALRSADVTSKSTSKRWRDAPLADPAWVPASSLTDHVLVEPVLDGVLTPDYATREFCRLLGYYLAEGHILRNKQGEIVGVRLSTHRDDAVHAEVAQLAEAVGTDNPPAWWTPPHSKLCRYVYIHDRWFATKCLELAGSGAKTKRLAEEVLHWHPDLQAELLGAYINGDGFNAGKGALGISTSNRDLAFQVLSMLPRLGVAASLQGLNHKVGTGFSRTNTREWVIHIGKQYTAPFVGRCNKLRQEPVFKEKNSRKFYGERLLTPIRAIKKVWEETDVYNIDVEEDDSYLVSGLAVHNSKVPFDTSSITLDWKKYRQAQATFDPKRDRHPGAAVLEFHKKLKEKNGVGIRGLSITRDDYDEWCTRFMNRILPDGRKVFVWNDYPRFFDISFVFIGADRTAKTMVYIFRGDGTPEPSAKVAHILGYTDEGDDLEKSASIEDKWIAALTKGAEKKKQGEIDKDVIPSQLAAKAVPVLTGAEPSLPPDILDALASVPESHALSSVTGMGIVLRPSEFQRISLSRMGMQPLADSLDQSGTVFPQTPADGQDMGLDSSNFVRGIGRLLAPFMAMRSALGPFIERRIVVIQADPKRAVQPASSHPSKLLRKIGAAYSSYRDQLMDLAPSAQELIERTATPRDAELLKVAQASAQETFTPLSYCYLRDAFLDEAPFVYDAGAVVEPS